MRRTARPAFLLLSLLALAACAPTSGARPDAGAPLPVAGYDWFLNEDPDEPRLSYGYAQSDDVPLSLMCRPGSGTVRLALQSEAGARGPLRLESGGETETYPAAPEPSEMHEGVHLIASAPAADPVFQRFGRLGWLAVLKGDERWMMAAQPGSVPRAARFLALCG